jgi:hypothetical protein
MATPSQSGVQYEFWGQPQPESREDRSRARERLGSALQMVMHDQVQSADQNALLALPVSQVERINHQRAGRRNANFYRALVEATPEARDMLPSWLSDFAHAGIGEQAVGMRDRRIEGRRGGGRTPSPPRPEGSGDRDAAVEALLNAEPDARYRLW